MNIFLSSRLSFDINLWQVCRTRALLYLIDRNSVQIRYRSEPWCQWDLLQWLLFILSFSLTRSLARSLSLRVPWSMLTTFRRSNLRRENEHVKSELVSVLILYRANWIVPFYLTTHMHVTLSSSPSSSSTTTTKKESKLVGQSTLSEAFLPVPRRCWTCMHMPMCSSNERRTREKMFNSIDECMQLGRQPFIVLSNKCISSSLSSRFFPTSSLLLNWTS